MLAKIIVKVVSNMWFNPNRFVRLLLSRIRDRINVNIGPFYQSYSLEGEDMIMRSYFSDRSHGFYVDVGANDPYRQSNTAYFYELGWTGVNIDASSEVISHLKKVREDDICVRALISDKTKRATLYKFNDSALNTVVKKLADRYSRISGYRIIGKETITALPLKKILDKTVKAGTKIDFMSIDVEGFEMNVLRSNDWSQYKPEVIVCESLDIGSIRDVSKSEVYKYLVKLGYTCFAKTTTNLFFCYGNKK